MLGKLTYRILIRTSNSAEPKKSWFKNCKCVEDGFWENKKHFYVLKNKQWGCDNTWKIPLTVPLLSTVCRTWGFPSGSCFLSSHLDKRIYICPILLHFHMYSPSVGFVAALSRLVLQPSRITHIQWVPRPVHLDQAMLSEAEASLPSAARGLDLSKLQQCLRQACRGDRMIVATEK